jgi:hypothetical protein
LEKGRTKIKKSATFEGSGGSCEDGEESHMKTGNAIIATFFLATAHIVSIVCFFAVPLLIHYGADPANIPMDPASLAIPFWFIYIFIGILFMISGMEMQQKIKFRTKLPAQEQQTVAFTEPKKKPSNITHKVIQPETNEMSKLKKEIMPIVINKAVMPKKDVSDIEKHVDEILLSVERKNGFDVKKEDLSKLKKEIIPNIIIPQVISVVDKNFDDKKIEHPSAKQPDTIINNVDTNINNLHIEIDKLRNEIAERRKKQEQLTKEVENIEP